MILENRSREYVEARVRAGVIEQGSFRPLSIAPPPTAPAVPPLVTLDSDILPLARHRTFGVEGRVVEEGAPSALREERGLFSSLLSRQEIVR